MSNQKSAPHRIAPAENCNWKIITAPHRTDIYVPLEPKSAPHRTAPHYTMLQNKTPNSAGSVLSCVHPEKSCCTNHFPTCLPQHPPCRLPTERGGTPWGGRPATPSCACEDPWWPTAGHGKRNATTHENEKTHETVQRKPKNGDVCY